MNFSTVEVFKHIPVSEGMVEIEGDELAGLQALLLEILKEFSEVCRKHDIEFTLSGGTLLGAVRHGGFIPWDDDVDVNMTRSGYEKFVSIFDEELGEEYWLHGPEFTDNYGIGLARIRKKGTEYRDRESFDTEECGVFIDIFIYEDVPNQRIVRSVHGLVSLGLGFALSCRRFLLHYDEYMKLAAGNPDLEKTFKAKRRLGKVFSILDVDTWCRTWNKWNSLYRNDNSKYLSIPAGRKHYFGEMFDRELMLPAKWAKFEDVLMPIPNTPDHYLTKLYGDYMRVPEPEEREAHVVYKLDLGGEA